jgi:hypothetical protein
MVSVAATAIAVGGELLITLFQAYMLAAKQQGLSAEQAKASFDAHYDQFMALTDKPVEPVQP